MTTPSETATAKAFWLQTPQALSGSLGCDLDGLTAADAQARLERYGRNVDRQVRQIGLIRSLAKRLLEPLALVLIAAAVVSGATGDSASAIIIVVILLLSIGLDTIQERRAMKAAEALRQSVAVRTEVKRDGQFVQVPAEEIVPGDVIRVRAGDVVPADALVLASDGFAAGEAALTGEPYPVDKHPGPSTAKTAADASNALFRGAVAQTGEATALVAATGRATLFGAAAAALNEANTPSPFQHDLRVLGFLIMRMTLLLVLFVLAAHIMFGPAVAAVADVLGRLGGGADARAPADDHHRDPGAGGGADGGAQGDRQAPGLDPRPRGHDGALHRQDRHAHLRRDQAGQERGAGRGGRPAPRPTGRDLRRPGRRPGRAGLRPRRRRAGSREGLGARQPPLVRLPAPRRLGGRRRAGGPPPDRQGRAGSHPGRLRRDAGSERRRAMSAADRAAVQASVQALAEQGLRTVAVASKAAPSDTAESGLAYEGLCAFADPPKATAPAAIAGLAATGVKVKMLSGDDPVVVKRMAALVGLRADRVLTGPDIAALSADALKVQVLQVDAYARLAPDQKSRIVHALQAAGEVVGFLGDGINDAPGLKAADIGLSVDGASGVAREAADMILLAPDLEVVADGVREGRRTFANILKYVRMAAGSNFGNMLSMAAASLLLPFLPMLPTQILLNNLIYDVSEIGLPFDEVSPEETAKPQVFSLRRLLRFAGVMGPLSSVFDMITFAGLYWWFRETPDAFRTGWFIESMATQILVIFLIRTKGPFWKSRPHRP
ncbi:MAG: HAD-IC family P-type ATPase [Caulobacteraceae bacterium]